MQANIFTWKEFLGLFIHLAGFVIGLGAGTVIDLHGFLGRKSSYWTEATTRTRKVTKPLIWLGITMAIIGTWLFHGHRGWTFSLAVQAVIAIVLVVNGLFPSFHVSPFLLRRELEGRASELLPADMQKRLPSLSYFPLPGGGEPCSSRSIRYLQGVNPPRIILLHSRVVTNLPDEVVITGPSKIADML